MQKHILKKPRKILVSVTQVNFFFCASLSGSSWQRTIRFAVLNTCTCIQQKSKFSSKNSAASKTPVFLQFCINLSLLLDLLCIFICDISLLIVKHACICCNITILNISECAQYVEKIDLIILLCQGDIEQIKKSLHQKIYIHRLYFPYTIFNSCY